MPKKKNSVKVNKRPQTLHEKDPHQHLKLKICVSGAAETGHCAPDALEKTEELGREIARRGHVLVTGATTGAPLWAAKGAKEEGGIVVGLSPAVSEAAHVKSYHLPLDYHDLIVYTGFDYAGRNLLLTRASDAVITVCGRMGTLNEFTIAFEDNKPIGIYEGTGGMADEIRGIVRKAKRGPGKIIYSNNPQKLLDQLEELIMKEKGKNGKNI